ncbi:hypothetical protein EPH_0060640 [Eimeria praecox]|uniref:Uncharacterized protein n=1 Tax=Eimeria praecox TaxID=51316 RepID=U6H2T1_9EIME|nr:hypothetical protein EPH_0060640 [Eimeria praecox]
MRSECTAYWVLRTPEGQWRYVTSLNSEGDCATEGLDFVHRQSLRRNQAHYNTTAEGDGEESPRTEAQLGYLQLEAWTVNAEVLPTRTEFLELSQDAGRPSPTDSPERVPSKCPDEYHTVLVPVSIRAYARPGVLLVF